MWAARETVADDDGRLAVAEDLTVVGDGTRVRGPFENLFADAVEHAGAVVTVTVGPLDGADGFSVADDGHGIPAADRERVFEPGHSGNDDGTGFGRHIVRTVAAAHDWMVAVTEAATGGARVEVRAVETVEAAHVGTRLFAVGSQVDPWTDRTAGGGCSGPSSPARPPGLPAAPTGPTP